MIKIQLEILIIIANIIYITLINFLLKFTNNYKILIFYLNSKHFILIKKIKINYKKNYKNNKSTYFLLVNKLIKFILYHQ